MKLPLKNVLFSLKWTNRTQTQLPVQTGGQAVCEAVVVSLLPFLYVQTVARGPDFDTRTGLTWASFLKCSRKKNQPS